ncbi:MAG TPA: hypothetical protein PK878_19595 [bacterium]|nr:hypothetical protein [bacterium]HPO99180.1 hypothetical protein [bacterium]
MKTLCRQFQESYGEPTLPETLRIHGESCPACQEFARRQQALETMLPVWSAPDFSPDFTLAVISRLAEEKQCPEGLGARFRRWWQTRLSVPLPVGVLATLLLLFSLGLNLVFWNREPPAFPDTPAVAQIPERPPTPGIMSAYGSGSLPQRVFFSTGAFLLIPLGNTYFPMDSGEALSIPNNGNGYANQAY